MTKKTLLSPLGGENNLRLMLGADDFQYSDYCEKPSIQISRVQFTTSMHRQIVVYLKGGFWSMEVHLPDRSIQVSPGIRGSDTFCKYFELITGTVTHF
jgi:hypothetical protein